MDEILAAALKVAKVRPCNYVLVWKDAKSIKLIVSKKVITKGAVTAARKAVGAVKQVAGTCHGEGGAFVFEKLEEDPEPPQSTKVMKALIERETKLKLKPEFRVVTTFSAVPTGDVEDDAGGAEGGKAKDEEAPPDPEVARLAMRFQAVVQSVKASGVDTAELKPLLSGAGQAAKKERFADAHKLLDAVEKKVLVGRTTKLLSSVPDLDLTGLEIEPSSVGPELVSVQGVLDVHPDKLASLDPAQAKELLDALKDPGANADTLKKFASSGSHRLRYGEHAEQAGKFLAPLLPGNREFAALWQGASQGEKFRAFDLFNAHKAGMPGAPNLNQQCLQYAMAQRPASIPELVEHFEFCHTLVLQEALDRAEIEERKLIAKGQKIGKAGRKKIRRQARAAVDAEMGGSTLDGRKLGGIQASYEEYKGAVAEVGVGPTAVGAGDTPDARGAEIEKAAGKLRFASVSAGAYHVLKHYVELPSADKVPNAKYSEAQNRVASYLNSARLSVRSGAWSSQVGQMGGESHYFVRSGMKAIVRLVEQSAILATYFTA